MENEVKKKGSKRKKKTIKKRKRKRKKENMHDAWLDDALQFKKKAKKKLNCSVAKVNYEAPFFRLLLLSLSLCLSLR